MMKVKDILNCLSAWAPNVYQESYDNSGLLVGNGQAAVTGVLTTLDTTEEVLDEAVSKGCNLVVSHHPIIFSGLKRLTGSNYVERTVIKALKADIAIYAIHTNLDNVFTGVNHQIAQQLGLQSLNVLLPKKGLESKLVTFVPPDKLTRVRTALAEAGAGQIGNYTQCSFQAEGKGTFLPGDEANPYLGQAGKLEEANEVRLEMVFPSHLSAQIVSQLIQAHPYEEVAYFVQSLDNHQPHIGAGMLGLLPQPMPALDFMAMLKEKMNISVIKHTAIHKPMVHKIAVCGGAGGFLLSKAMSAGADVLVTSDYKYHEYFDADGRIIIADIGHYESEQFTKELLQGYLSRHFTDLPIFVSQTNTNPVNYFY